MSAPALDEATSPLGRPPRTLVRWERIFAGLYFPVFHGIELVHRGRWPDSGPLIVTSNHPTFWDPWLVGMGQRRYVYWMAWEELWTWPLVKHLVAAHRAFPVDLERPKPSTLKRARAVLDAGRPLGVFPEGERTSGSRGELDPFKPGLAWIACATDAPIAPVSIRGARRAWPKQRAYPLPGKITVTYHPVIETARILPGAPRREREAALLARLEQTIASEL